MKPLHRILQIFILITITCSISLLNHSRWSLGSQDYTWNFEPGDVFEFEYSEKTLELTKEGTVIIEILDIYPQNESSAQSGVKFNYTSIDTILEFQGESREADPIQSSNIYFSGMGKTLSHFLVSQDYLTENLSSTAINQTVHTQKIRWSFFLCGYGEGCFNQEIWNEVLSKMESFDFQFTSYPYGYRLSYNGKDVLGQEQEFLHEIEYNDEGILQKFHTIELDEEYYVTNALKSISVFPIEIILLLGILAVISMSIYYSQKLS